MPGYWRAPEATAEALDAEGWLHTGDIGQLGPPPGGGEPCMLYITGRKKDLIVTAGGRNVAPRKIELLLESSPWISQALVYGDRRPHLVALVVLDAAAVRRWAEERGLEQPDGVDLGDCLEVRGLIDTEVELANQRLEHYERIRRFAVVDEPWSVESGELTDSLKVKRNVVLERHRQRLDALYR